MQIPFTDTHTHPHLLQVWAIIAHTYLHPSSETYTWLTGAVLLVMLVMCSTYPVPLEVAHSQ